MTCFNRSVLEYSAVYCIRAISESETNNLQPCILLRIPQGLIAPGMKGLDQYSMYFFSARLCSATCIPSLKLIGLCSEHCVSIEVLSTLILN